MVGTHRMGNLLAKARIALIDFTSWILQWLMMESLFPSIYPSCALKGRHSWPCGHQCGY